MGSWTDLYDLFSPLIKDFATFMQSLALIVALAMVVYYKVREITADVQEDQMFAQKTKKVFIATAFIFIVPTIIKIIENYLKK